ncbi:MAG: hypothetical protein LBU18_00795 [Treponema sp.]|nr:hypothetical protein [Treponema sp.]
MTYSGYDMAAAEQIGSAMRTEMEWMARDSGYVIKQSGNILETDASMDILAAGDRSQNPKYLVNGMLYMDGAESIVDILLWDLEGPSLVFSQSFNSDQTDLITYYTWSLYSILPLLDTSDEAVKAARAEAEAARAEAEAARAAAEEAAIAGAAKGETVTEAAETPAAVDESTARAEDTAAANDTPAEKWKSWRLYLGLKGGLDYRFYNFSELDVFNGWTWAVGAKAEFQFIRFPWGRRNTFLALQTEGILTIDYMNFPDDDQKNSFLSFMAPVLLKFNYRPGLFNLSLYGGIYYFMYPANIPYPLSNLGKEDAAVIAAEETAYNYVMDSLGYIGGLKLGISTGNRGAFFIDLRYAADMGTTGIYYEQQEMPSYNYKRYSPSASLGYEIGLFNWK